MKFIFIRKFVSSDRLVDVLLQIVCFQQVLNVSYMEYFMYLLKNQVECIFLALLSCQHLYTSH